MQKEETEKISLPRYLKRNSHLALSLSKLHYGKPFFTDNKSMQKNDQIMCLHLFIICQSVMKYFLQKSFHDQSLPAWSPRSHF